MDSYKYLPDFEIKNSGRISTKFLELGIKSFKEACNYVHRMEYGYNTNYEDDTILFKECKGTCTTKHGVIALLAKEHDVPLFRYVGIYKFTEEISSGANTILEKYKLPFIAMIHCFLVYQQNRFDLTEGNFNGKNHPIHDFIDTRQVSPNFSQKDEYLWYKQVLNKKVLPSQEMHGKSEIEILKARQEGVILLKDKVKLK